MDLMEEKEKTNISFSKSQVQLASSDFWKAPPGIEFRHFYFAWPLSGNKSERLTAMSPQVWPLLI